MIDRRGLLGTIASVALGAPFASVAQQPSARLHHIGFLSAETPLYETRRLEVLRTELRRLGYVEGGTFAIEARFAEGSYDRLSRLARELVELRVDLIVTSGSKAGFAAKSATATIPIVVSNMGDALDARFISSYAQPGGNVTGMSALGSESATKQLDLLKQIKPQLNVVGVLLNPANPNVDSVLGSLRSQAEAQRVILEPVAVRNAGELPLVFAAFASKHIDALVVVSDTMFGAHGKTIADLAMKQRMLSVGTFQFAHDGGLFGYSSDRIESFRRLVTYIDKVLKGAKPAELPVEQPTKLLFVVNLKTAKALGVEIPQSLLLRADDVIR